MYGDDLLGERERYACLLFSALFENYSSQQLTNCIYFCGHLSNNIGYLLCSPPEKLHYGTVQKSPGNAFFPATEL